MKLSGATSSTRPPHDYACVVFDVGILGFARPRPEELKHSKDTSHLGSAATSVRNCHMTQKVFEYFNMFQTADLLIAIFFNHT